ncbi:MAG: epoxyqueuosine reductase QueH [Deltaproteobacteria bacterium]|nr:epoxyqueuosine reductase QueH [Deltaproteobacteria bacterium]
MKLLIHICCGPCAVYPLKRIFDGKMEVWGFFFNPNIHPYTEYQKRLGAVKILADKMDVKMIYRDEYGLEEFLKNTINNIDARCNYCYSSRLEATVQAAKENHFDYFSSSLLYSKRQDHELIRGIGKGIGERFGVPFYYDDFRIGWKQGIKESKDMGLYRQQYCGCIFSERERYLAK